MAFETTPAHQAIFDAVAAKDGNIVIEAVAGAGKTTTIIRALDHIPRRERCVFLAFNASIAKELAGRVPKHVDARTLNGFGHRAWADHLRQQGLVKSARDLDVQSDKVRDILFDMEDDAEISTERRKLLHGPTMRLVRLAKAHGIIPDDNPRRGLEPDAPETWDRLFSHFDLDTPDGVEEHEVIELTRELLRRSLKKHVTIDFDDQLYLPFVYEIKMRPYDRIIVDEAQDLSPLQHDLLARGLKRSGQLIAVGDPCQAIYGFRGADSDSMANLARRFRCRKLPLHVSYRCPQKVVALAQTVVEHIQSHESAPEGIVANTPAPTSRADLRGGDLVVCRTTAPVVAAAFALIRQKIPAEVLGRDIGQGLLKLIEKLEAKTIPELLDALDAWERKEVEKERKRKRPSDSKIARIQDQAATIECLTDGVDDLHELIGTIERMFSGRRADWKVTLCTVHKAKGLEADRVFVLDRSLMPHKMATQPWEKVQEKNLIYVAYTRAKKELRFLTSDQEADDAEAADEAHAAQ